MRGFPIVDTEERRAVEWWCPPSSHKAAVVWKTWPSRKVEDTETELMNMAVMNTSDLWYDSFFVGPDILCHCGKHGTAAINIDFLRKSLFGSRYTLLWYLEPTVIFQVEKIVTDDGDLLIAWRRAFLWSIWSICDACVMDDTNVTLNESCSVKTYYTCATVKHHEVWFVKER